MQYLVPVVMAAAAVNYLLPYLWVKLLQRGAIFQIGQLWQGGAGAAPPLALTFDDGPDPETTPRVLQVLAEERVRATFFVQGDRAAAHPELVRRMLAEGHEVASHGYHHRSAARRWPWECFRDIHRGADTLAQILGRRPRYYRPPFGVYTMAVLLGARSAGLRPVQWTLDGRDWDPATTVPQIVDHLSREARPGGIILLHDEGSGGHKTAQVLPLLIRRLRAKGLGLAPLSERLTEGAGPALREGWAQPSAA